MFMSSDFCAGLNAAVERVGPPGEIANLAVIPDAHAAAWAGRYSAVDIGVTGADGVGDVELLPTRALALRRLAIYFRWCCIAGWWNRSYRRALCCPSR